MHPTMRAIMADVVRHRHREGQTFVLVRHDMPIVKELCPRSACMIDEPSIGLFAKAGMVAVVAAGGGKIPVIGKK